MIITLPLPSPLLSPNGPHRHWAPKAKARNAARQLAHLTTLSALQGQPPPTFTRYALTFFHPVIRTRDDDNALASTKAYRDGIAKALRVDDSTLRIHAAPEFRIDRSHPRLEIHLLP